MFLNSVLWRPKKTGFTLIELVVSLGVVGLVILPLLLTSTTIISKGLVDSASHSKSNFQLSEMFNQMRLVFDSSSTMVRPIRPIDSETWDPRREFEITYYNANRGLAEKVGYQLINVDEITTGAGFGSTTVGGRWFLRKSLDNGTSTGNSELSSPYGTLASDQVEILPLEEQDRPQFNYCNSNGTCSNNPDQLTPAFLSGLAFVRLEMRGVQITSPDIKQEEGLILTGNQQFMIGKKFGQQAAGDLNTASIVSVTPLTAFYGVANQNQIRGRSASLNKKTNTSLVIPTTTWNKDLVTPIQSVPLTAPAPQTLLTQATILRVVVDQIRGNYAFVAQKGGAINLYFYNAVRNQLTLVTSNIRPSGRPDSNFTAGDYPLVIDEFTGKVFWTSNDKGTAKNRYGKSDAGAGTNKMHLLGWDPYQPADIFLVDSRNEDLATIHYTLIPDHQNGTLWALQDNGISGTSGNTQIVGIDTYSMRTVFDKALNTIDTGASTFDYINSWDITNGAGSSVSGDLFLGALNTYGNRMGMIYLKANRDGINVSITSRSMTTGDTEAAPATPSTPEISAKENPAPNNPLSATRVVANDLLRTAGFLTRAKSDGVRDFYFMNYSSTTKSFFLAKAPDLAGSAPVPAIDPPFNVGLSHQPRQVKQWFHHNNYFGIANDRQVVRWGNGSGALWVNAGTNDLPDFGGGGTSITMGATGVFPNLTLEDRRSGFFKTPLGTYYRVNYPTTGDCFRDMGIDGSQVITPDRLLRVYSALYTGTSTTYQTGSGVKNCSTQTGYPTTQKGIIFQHIIGTGNNTPINVSSGDTLNYDKPFQNLKYVFKNMNGQDPWMIPLPTNSPRVVFTYWDGKNYRLDVATRAWISTAEPSVLTFTTGADSTRPSIPSSFMKDAKEKDIIGINYNRMELMVTNASGDVVLWKFGGGRQNFAVDRNGNFSTRQAESARHLRLENLDHYMLDALSIAEDNSNAYVLVGAQTRGISRPARVVRFKCDPRLKEGSKNNSAFCYRVSELTLHSTFPSLFSNNTEPDPSPDITVNHDSNEAFILVGKTVYRIPDRNAVGPAPTTGTTPWGLTMISNPWFTGSEDYGGGIAHSSKTGNLYVLRANQTAGPFYNVTRDAKIRGELNRLGLLVGVIRPNAGNTKRVEVENILLPMERWAVENAFDDTTNAHYIKRQCGLRIDDQRDLLHLTCQNNTVATNTRNFVYTYQKPMNYRL
jgi:hypothetical protein